MSANGQINWIAFQPHAPQRALLRTRYLVLVALFALGVIVGLVLLLMPQGGTRAAVPVVDAAELVRLESMTEGEEATPLQEGDEARERNALIPFAGGALEKVTGYTVVAADRPQYGTALTCLTQAIYYEAANESDEGKRAVAQVVINRMRHPAYPNSVCGVVYQGSNEPVCQFSFTCDGALLRRPIAEKWAQSRRIAASMLAGGTEPSVGSATHYHADYVLPRWAYTLAKTRQIGTHIFYRFPGRAGGSAMLYKAWSGMEAIPALDMDMLRLRLAEVDDLEERFVPGLTVEPDVKDRHAANDVGGRIDTRKEWRLTIPDPVETGSSLRAAKEGQNQKVAAKETPETPET